MSRYLPEITLCKDQPPLTFIEDLKKPFHLRKPSRFGERPRSEKEIDMDGMYLVCEFSDDNGLLETVYADFERFLDVYEMRGNRYSVTVRYAPTSCFEEYCIEVRPSGAVIQAADTEGIRRGIYHLEDLLIQSELPALEEQTLTRRPFVRTRITRNVFSPTNRPPLNIDELYNDIDYYPDEYLNKIAHDGNNGIWIYTHFNELLKSEIITEYGEHSEERLEKLRHVVRKCARYGIKVYVFGVEPSGLTPELAEKYHDMVGVSSWDKITICPRTERGRAYCIETTERLFRAVPDLGGYIDITAGERVTTCPSVKEYVHCPRCGQYSRGENLSYCADLIKEGMRRAGTKAEFISWSYGHREWNDTDILEYVRTVPEDVMQMHNFEEYGFKEQLGKKRFAIDYWLSYPGPSDRFVQAAQEANRHNKHLFAKMQVCNSHELASVPYLPIPDLIFDKYKAAYEYRVEGILQCWYMGNYPSVMSKAAGELAFCSDFSDKEAFLTYLAGVLFGKRAASNIVKAWQLFSEGYRNYPTNIMFSYYGPMHDGVSWELSLNPKNIEMPRSWHFEDDLRGDRIGDALQCGHTLNEAVALCSTMYTQWEKGMVYLSEDLAGEMYSIAKALLVLFRSGVNILRFYQLREKLGYNDGDAGEILSQMEALVRDEIENSRAMIELCHADDRLGYHSEAGAFKFYPSRMENRIRSLENLLAVEVPAVRQRVKNGKQPLAYYAAEGFDGYKLETSEEAARWENIEAGKAFRIFYDEDKIYLDIQCPPSSVAVFSFEFRLFHPGALMKLCDGRVDFHEDRKLHHSLVGDTLVRERAKFEYASYTWGTRIVFDRKLCGWEKTVPLKFGIQIDEQKWKDAGDGAIMLAKHPFLPDEFGWLLP